MRHHHDQWRASRDPYPMDIWIAFRIKGARPERHARVIWAETEAEALAEAYEAFECTTPNDKLKVFVLKRHP